MTEVESKEKRSRRRRIQRAILLAAALVGSGCPATVGASGMVMVPEDAAETCAGLCRRIGAELSAVAIMASNVGCVCVPSSARADRASAAVTGGMAIILLQEEARRAQSASATAVSPPH